MKEKMLLYLENDHWTSGNDNAIIKDFIDKFFNKYQPERSKREDYAYCIGCENNSREPEKGAGHYCHKCKEYDYA